VVIYGVGVLFYFLYAIYLVIKSKHKLKKDQGDEEEETDEQGMEMENLDVAADAL
jgi:Ca2+/Na+ antiporter